MYERFTDRARKVMQLALQEAQRFNHEYIGTEHILLGLIKEGSGVAANVLKNLDMDLRKVRLEVEQIVRPGPDWVRAGKLPQTPRGKIVIRYAIEEARNLNHNYVGTEHLLLGLLREQEGVAAQVLMNLGLKLEDVREGVLNLLGHNVVTEKSVKKDAAPDQPAPAPRLVLSELRPSDPVVELRVRELEFHLLQMRFVLGGVLGLVAGYLLEPAWGCAAGFFLGGLVAVSGRPWLGALVWLLPGAILGTRYLAAPAGQEQDLLQQGTVLGAFLGAILGGLCSLPSPRHFRGL